MFWQNMAKESKILSTLSHDHEMPVELTANHVVRQGYTRVRASHTNRFTACDQIGEYIPDVTAFLGNAVVVAEAESRDGLVQAHTEAQLRRSRRPSMATSIGSAAISSPSSTSPMRWRPAP
jgi:hypothetical protein